MASWKMKKVVLATLLGFASVMLARSSSAQAVTATLVGSVVDQDGAVVPGAKIIATATNTGQTRSVNSNESGNYSIPDIIPGSYSVTVEAGGFRRQSRTAVEVIVDTTSRVDFKMTVGDVSQTVTVSTAPPLLQTDRGDVSTKLEAEKLEDLPIGNNRNFQVLLNLVPGTTPAVVNNSAFFNAAGTLQTNVNGTPIMGNVYQIEGVDDEQRTGTNQILIPPADAISTVDVATNNYEAELGRAIGAVTNVTLKSGTNRFHGSASEYLQNSFFNAKSYFNTTGPVAHVAYNYFGGTLGGPIIRDKLFFFADYFRTSDHEANSNIVTIPFKSASTCVNGFIDLSAGLVAPASGAVYGRGQIFDPATGNATTGAGRTPFANNRIPCSRVNPVALNILGLLPAPNQNLNTTAAPTNNYFATLPFQKTADTYDGKIDYQLSEKDHLSFRYELQHDTVFQQPIFGSAGGGAANGAFAGTGVQNAYSTGLNYDRAFSSKLLTEVRVGVAHNRNVANPSDFGVSDATALGVPGVNIAGNPFTGGQVGIGLGSFSSPLIGYSASMPWVRGETNIDIVNHWTLLRGNHTFKAGIDLRRVRDALLQGQTFSPRGVYNFGENQTSTVGATTNFSNDIASLLLDTPSSAGRDLFTYSPQYRQWWIFSFIGDKWQASKKLTLDYGVRWELYPPATPAVSGGLSNYDPVQHTLVIAGIGNNPSNLGLQNRFSYFAPRTGFAYRFSEGTVFRGGYGISYTPVPDNNFAYNYPIRANNSYGTPGTNSTYGAAVLADGSTTATFQAGFPAPVAVPIPTNGIIPVAAGSTLASSAFSYIPSNYHNPYIHTFNLAIQQALPQNFSLTIAFVGNHGSRISTGQNINLPSVFGGGNATLPDYAAVDPNTGAQYKRTAATNQYYLGNSTNYEALQLQLNRRFTKGLSSTSAFTWGKGLGYQSSNDGGLTFWQERRRNYAPNDFDRRLNFEQSFTYELPVGPGKAFLSHGVVGRAIGGFRISGVVSIVSGTPFTVTANNNLNTPGEAQTANLVGTYRVLHGTGTTNQWFDPASFGQPTGCASICTPVAGVNIGNTGRNAYYGPGYVQDNVSVFKTYKLMEGSTLELRADVLQLSNTPQFANPSASITSTTFGKITSVVGSGTGVNGTGGGRSMQLAGIFRF
jgi:hypothetical protein